MFWTFSYQKNFEQPLTELKPKGARAKVTIYTNLNDSHGNVWTPV